MAFSVRAIDVRLSDPESVWCVGTPLPILLVSGRNSEARNRRRSLTRSDERILLISYPKQRFCRDFYSLRKTDSGTRFCLSIPTPIRGMATIRHHGRSA
jgi:hypothetical protein